MTTLLNTEKAAEMLCLSEKTLRKWRWEGKGPHFVKVGRKVAYRMSDVQKWLEGRVRCSTSDCGEGR